MNVKSILKETGEEDPARVYKLELANRNIKEMSSLKQLQKLRCLVLSYNLIERIENLQVFADLRELHLQNNTIQKIEGLQANKALQVLNLSDNCIEKIQNLGHLLRLQTLVLDSNKITKISGLQYLKQLKHISVKNNVISSIQNLPAFSKLISLNFSHNKISKISDNLFTSSKNLSFLDLSHNKIQNTSFLEAMTGLQNVNLSHNCIKVLKVNAMPNLESLNVSNNQLYLIPSVALIFPEIMSLDLSYNMICSELDLIQALCEVQYLTELDFRQNPMHSQSFENTIQKLHSFDFLNGRIMTKAGAKYYEQVNKIKDHLEQNSFMYGQDDQRDRQIKMSGFYDDELQFKMSGMKVNRPQTPPKKKKNLEKATFYDDIDRIYNQFVNGDLRIKVIREQYLKMYGDYTIASQHILTQVPFQNYENNHKSHSMQEKSKEQIQSQTSQQFINTETEIRKQNQTNLNKWKELKQREKSFNIRDVIKKSRGRDSSVNKGATATSAWGSNGFKAEKMKSELLRTQALPRKHQQLYKTMVRPSSMRKKQ